jgi:hypothetical protein
MDEDEIDYDELIDSFDLDEALICCEDCGIHVENDGHFALDTIRASLRNRYVYADRDPETIFAEVDADSSGSIGALSLPVPALAA